MAKYNGYGKRFTGPNRVEYIGARGLHTTRLSYKNPGDGDAAWLTNRRMDNWIAQAAKPEWKPLSEKQRVATINVLTNYRDRLIAADPEKRDWIVRQTWVSIAEANAAIERLQRGSVGAAPIQAA